MAVPFSVYGNIVSPFLLQRLKAQTPLTSIDVLPPELQTQLDALKPPIVTADATTVIDQNRYTDFNNQALNVGVISQLVLRQSSTRRTFLFVVNTHATQTLFIRFGANADMIIGVPIQPLFGFFGFDTVVPQDDIYLVANGAATTGVLVYSNAP